MSHMHTNQHKLTPYVIPIMPSTLVQLNLINRTIRLNLIYQGNRTTRDSHQISSLTLLLRIAPDTSIENSLDTYYRHSFLHILKPKIRKTYLQRSLLHVLKPEVSLSQIGGAYLPVGAGYTYPALTQSQHEMLPEYWAR